MQPVSGTRSNNAASINGRADMMGQVDFSNLTYFQPQISIRAKNQTLGYRNNLLP